MKNWGNWSYTALKKVVVEAMIDNEKYISIDQEHTDYQNDMQVNSWLDEMKLEYKNEMERTIIYFK